MHHRSVLFASDFAGVRQYHLRAVFDESSLRMESLVGLAAIDDCLWYTISIRTSVRSRVFERTHLVAASLHRHIHQSFQNSQAHLLALLAPGYSNVFDATNKPKIMQAKCNVSAKALEDELTQRM